VRDQLPVEGASIPESRVRDHLANERTLLAWQRTALTIVGLGFVVDRFALGSGGGTAVGSAAVGSAAVGSWVGLALVVLGGTVSGVGAYRYLKTEREIDTSIYRSSITVHLVLTAAIVIGALALAVFLALTPAR
jgi:putative membrane protein